MANTFVCAMCGGEFEKGWDESEALEELKEVWGDISPDDCDQVCDDCWEKVKPANNQELFANWQATQHGLHLTAGTLPLFEHLSTPETYPVSEGFTQPTSGK